MTTQGLEYFLRESLRIEGIHREPTRLEITATEDFLRLPEPILSALENLVEVYQPGAILRRRPTMNVRVGSHVAPQGGPRIITELESILADAARGDDPWAIHCRYETLHPFMDGNGRSGRALWAWQMVRRQGGLPLGFLHQFYYQTLANSPQRSPASSRAL